MQHPVIDAVDAQLKAAGLPTYTELTWRAHDVAEGIEDMKLPGSVPARLKKLKDALFMAFGQTKPVPGVRAARRGAGAGAQAADALRLSPGPVHGR